MPGDAEPGGEPVVEFPIIKHAMNDLASRRLMPADEFYAADDMARATGFTVSRVATLATVEKIQALLVDDVEHGGTLAEFKENVAKVMEDEGPLSPAHIETVYRVNVGKAYSEGMDRVLRHPLVSVQFPFEETVPIHDSRLTNMCAIVSRSGIGGTGIYHRDDPEWHRLKPPRHWNCRCARIPISLKDAADRGIAYAEDWQKNGFPLGDPPFVARVPVELPKGWVPAGAAA